MQACALTHITHGESEREREEGEEEVRWTATGTTGMRARLKTREAAFYNPPANTPVGDLDNGRMQ